MTAPSQSILTQGEGRPTLTAGGWRRLMWWKRLHPAAELTIGLLQTASGWKADRHYLRNDRFGVVMWISNRWYGFSLRIDGGQPGPENVQPGYPLDRWSRCILIAHVKQFLARGKVRDNSDEIAAFAHRITRELTKDLAA